MRFRKRIARDRRRLLLQRERGALVWREESDCDRVISDRAEALVISVLSSIANGVVYLQRRHSRFWDDISNCCCWVIITSILGICVIKDGAQLRYLFSKWSNYALHCLMYELIICIINRFVDMNLETKFYI